MSDAEPVVTFKRKAGKSRPAALRKRADDNGGGSSSSAASTSAGIVADDTPADASEVVYATKRAINNPLVQGTSRAQALAKRKRAGQGQYEDALADEEEQDDDDDKDDDVLVRHNATTKRPRRRSSSPPAHVSGEMISAAEEYKLKKAGVDGKKKDDDDDEADAGQPGLYKGAAKAKNQLPKSFGPLKAGPDNIRTISLVDYQPDVCKDYKETGFCGFGDTCKFLHDRSDYLRGWELDNSYLSSNAAANSFLAKQAQRNKRPGESDDDNDSDSDSDDLPFACLICRQPFRSDPVVTLCGHYYDSDCAIKRFGKTAKCFACGKPTGGVFNKAHKLIKTIKERERLRLEAEKEEEGEGGGADDGGVEIEGLAEG